MSSPVHRHLSPPSLQVLLASALFLTIALLPAFEAWADDVAWPKVRAKGVLLVDLNQRQVLYESNAGKRLAPASLTKIMTALVAIEEGDPDGIVTVSRHAAGATGHRLRLRAGQAYRRGDLIDAMLVTSANDACRAVAESIGGSETAFVVMMNRYAKTLDLRDTHFQNACGFDAPTHYSTARDLAHLATTAMEHPAFAVAVAHRDGVLRTVDGRRTYRLRTTNRLMATQYEGAVGVKTGFTRGAGRCLIARVVREQGDVLLVMLNAPRRWLEAAALLTHAFETLAQAKTVGDDLPSIAPSDDGPIETGPIPL